MGTSLADCSRRRVHEIDHYMVTYCDCIRVDFMYVGVAWVRPWEKCLTEESKVGHAMYSSNDAFKSNCLATCLHCLVYRILPTA